MDKRVIYSSISIMLLIILSLASIAYLDSSLLRVSTAVFTTVATIGLTCLTYTNVVNARKMLEESKQGRLIEILPFLRVEVEQKRPGYEPMEIIVRNVGNGPAINIDFSFEPARPGIQQTRQISCLGTGEKIDFDLGNLADYQEWEKINFSLAYQDLYERSHQREGYVSLNEHRRRNLTLVRDMDKIVKCLEQINHQLQRIADHLYPNNLRKLE